MKSSFTGQLSIVQYLLSKEADVDVRNQAGDTVLFSAAVCGDVSILACLVQAGAEVQVQNHDGDTPLLKAADLGSTASVEYLLEKGADIFTENKAGKTVFHLARVKEIKFVLAQRAQAIKEALANGIPMPMPIRKEEISSLKRKREDFEGNSNNKSEDEKESSIRKPSVSPLVTLADIACQQEESQAFGITSVPSVSNVPSSENEENKKLPGISLKAVDPSTGVNGKKKASSKRKAASALKSTASSNNDNIKVPVLPLNQLSSVFDDNKPTSSRSCISFDEQATIQPSRDIVLPTAPVSVNVASSSVLTTTVNWKLLYERELYMRITAETQVAALRDENGRLTNTIATMQWMQLMNKVNNPDASCDMDVSSAAFRSIADQLQSVTAATKPSSK